MTDPDLGWQLERMRCDWDERARANARYYDATAKERWDEAEFLRSGELSVTAEIVSDMEQIRHGQDPKQMRVLEIGCGAGRVTRGLATLFAEVHAVDVSGEMIARARQTLERFPNAFVYQNNGADLSVVPELEFDFAFSVIVFQHVPSREVIYSYCREVRRLLRPGALFKFQVQGDTRVESTPDDTWLGAPFSPDQIRDMADDCGFEVRHQQGAGSQYYWLWFVKLPESQLPLRRRGPAERLEELRKSMASQARDAEETLDAARDCANVLRDRLAVGRRLRAGLWRQNQAIQHQLGQAVAELYSEAHQLSVLRARSSAPTAVQQVGCAIRSLRGRVAQWLARAQQAAGCQPSASVIRHMVLESGIFDATYYAARYTDVPAGTREAFRHFLRTGLRERRSPHPLFDCEVYLAANPDIPSGKLHPLVHFLTAGCRENRSPHPLFDAHFYLERCVEARGDRDGAYRHFLRHGLAQARDPHALFDCAFYLANNPDVARSGMPPVVHYLSSGAWEGRDPHPLFDTSYYLEHNPDLAETRENPLIHYLTRGGWEGRNPHPWFDSAYYLVRNPEVRGAGVNPLTHFLRSGAREGRNPHPKFDVRFYATAHAECAAQGVNPPCQYS